MESSGSSNVYQEAPSPVEASSPEFFELGSDGEESEGVPDALAAGSKRQRRPSASYGEAHALFMICNNGAKLPASALPFELSVANKRSNRRPWSPLRGNQRLLHVLHTSSASHAHPDTLQ